MIFLAQTAPNSGFEIWTLVLSVLSLLITVGMGIGLFYVGAKASKIDGLENRLEKKAEQLVDARFETMTARMGGSLDTFKRVVEHMEKRLERGDAAFDAQQNETHELALKAQSDVYAARQWAAERFALISELRSLESVVNDIRTSLGSIGKACGN